MPTGRIVFVITMLVVRLIVRPFGIEEENAAVPLTRIRTGALT
jgi:hypothetical protein